MRKKVIIRSSAYLALILTLVLLGSGCASTDSVQKKLSSLCEAHQYQEARNLDVPLSLLYYKNDQIKSFVNPHEINYRQKELADAINNFIKENKYDAARDYIWNYKFDSVVEVTEELKKYSRKLLIQEVNIKQLQWYEPQMRRGVLELLAKNEFAQARKFLETFTPAKIYATALDDCLAAIRQSLLEQSLEEKKIDPIIVFAKKYLEELFKDMEKELIIKRAGSEFQPDMSKFENCLNELKRQMVSYGCKSQNSDELCSQIREFAEPLVKALYRPAEDIVEGFKALGTTALNLELIKLKLEIEKNINAQQIIYRSSDLRQKVTEALNNKDYAKAREIIYYYGIVGCTPVDEAIYKVKCALLNTYVNPGYWEAIYKEKTEKVKQYVAAGKYVEAEQEVSSIKGVKAYPNQIDEALEASLQAALLQRVDSESGRLLLNDTLAYLYFQIASRIGREDLEQEKFEPDWTEVIKQLNICKTWLEADDVPRGTTLDSADKLVERVLEKYRELVRYPGKKLAAMLTTYELNERLIKLRGDLKLFVSESLQKELEKKIAQENAKEAVKAEMAMKELQNLKQKMVQEYLSAIGLKSIILSLTVNRPDSLSDDIARIMGEAARGLRLLEQKRTISKSLANTLFVAGIYLGNEDLVKLAIMNGSEINGYSDKDSKKRPGILLAFEYGYNKVSLEYLQNADLSVKDALGATAYHYAIASFNVDAFQRCFNAGLSAKTADSFGTTPLMLASKMGYIEFVNALAGNSNVNAADNNGTTAIMMAAEKGFLDIIQTLVYAKADLSIKNKQQLSVLEFAAMSKSDEVIDYFLGKHKLVPNTLTAKIAISGACVHMLDKLVQNKLELNDEQFLFAIEKQSFDCIKYYVEKGFDVNQSMIAELLEKYDKNNDIARSIIAYLTSQGYSSPLK